MSLEIEDFFTPGRYAEEGRTSAQDTFDTMPILAIEQAQPGDILAINVATFVPPFLSESANALSRVISKPPRWQQGLELEVEEVELVEKLRYRAPVDLWNTFSSRFPADRAFTGKVALRDEVVAAHGIAHPRKPGWIQLAITDPDRAPMRTVADLKVQAGPLSAAAAWHQNHNYDLLGYFAVRTEPLY